MTSTFTSNINLEEPARGDDVGTWDTPVNANSTLLDLVCAGIATISLNNSNIVLSAAQFQSNGITFNSTLTGSVSITFPTSFKKPYFIRNSCTGSSAFTITLQTTASGGQVICCPPGESVDVVNDGTNLYFHNLERVGSYWDYGGSSVPAWVSGCTVPPYLNCDGSTFSATTYPQLAVILGSTTLPDSRGRGRAALNQGTTRMLSSNGGVDGNTNRAAGGGDTETLTLAQLPTGITVTGSLNLGMPGAVPYTTNGGGFAQDTGGLGAGGRAYPSLTSGSWQIFSSVSGGATGTLTSNNTSGNAHTVMQPTYVGGLTMIRAA